MPDECSATLREWANADPIGGKKERANARKKVNFTFSDLTNEDRREKEKEMLRTLSETMK